MRLKKFKKHTRLEIIWNDTVSESKWCSKEEIKKFTTAKISTIGMFLENSKKDIKVAGSVVKDESDITIIPWSVIDKIVVLVEKK